MRYQPSYPVSIQVRTSYQIAGNSGYGCLAVVEHLDGEPRKVPIRDTSRVLVLEDSGGSGLQYAGKMVRSQLAKTLRDVRERYPDAPVYN